MPWWGWIVLGVVILLGELIAATDFYLVFFAASAFVTGLLGLLGVGLPIPAQWLLFASLSIVSLLMFRSRLRESIRTREDHVDKLTGQTLIASEAIAPNATGRGELRGTAWSAKNVGATQIEAGDRCRVDEVEGLVLSVRKESS